MSDIFGTAEVRIEPEATGFAIRLEGDIVTAATNAASTLQSVLNAAVQTVDVSFRDLQATVVATAQSINALGSNDLAAIVGAASSATTSILDIGAAVELLDLSLDAIDNRDMASLVAAAEAATAAIETTIVAVELLDLTLDSLDTTDLAAIAAIAGVASSQIGAITTAVAALGLSLDALGTGDLAAIAAAATAAAAALASAAAAAGAADRSTSGMAVGLGNVNTGLGLTRVAALGAGAGLLVLGGYGAYVAGQFEQVSIAFEGLLGSAEEAQTFIAELQQFAARTPFDFPGLADASRKLLGVGFAVEEILPALTDIGNIAATLGVSTEQINGVIRALGQIQGKGRIMAQELNQISEQLPGFSAIKVIAEGLGVSTAEAFKMVEDGAVGADQGIQLILSGMREFPGAAEAMERQATTLIGLFSTFKDTLTLTLIDAFAPLAEQMKTLILPLGDALAGPLDALGPILASVFETLSTALFAVLPAIEALLTAGGPGLIDMFEGLTDVFIALTPALVEIGQGFGEVLTAVAPVITVLAQVLAVVAEGLSLILTFRDGLGLLAVATAAVAVVFVTTLLPAAVSAIAALGGISGAIAALTAVVAANPIGLLVVGIAAAAVALGVFSQDTGNAEDAVRQFNAQVATLESTFVGQADTAIGVARAFREMGSGFSDFLREQSLFQENDLVDELLAIGLATSTLQRQLLSGADGFKEFGVAAVASGQVVVTTTEMVQKGNRKVAEQVELTAEQVANLDGTLTDLANAGEITIQQGGELLDTYAAQVGALQTLERQEFEKLVTDGKLSAAQAEAILQLEEVAGATDTYGAALAAIPTELDKVTAGLDSVDIPLGQQGQAWAGLAEAIARGRVEVAGFPAIAEALGVDLETITKFAEGTTEALNEIVEEAISKLPTASDALGAFTDKFLAENQRIVDDINAKLKESLPEGETFTQKMEVELEELGSFQVFDATDIQNFGKEIDKTAETINQFDENLNAIRPISEEVANFLGEQGPEAAGKLAEALASMPEQIAPLEESMRNLNVQTLEYAGNVRDAAIDAPQEAAFLASRMTAEFELNLNFAETTAAEIERVNELLSRASQGFFSSAPLAEFNAGGPIKFFAEGDIVTSPTLGVFGEAGPEAVIPLNNPRRAAEIMDEAGLSGGGSVVVNVYPTYGPGMTEDQARANGTAEGSAIVERLSIMAAIRSA